MSSPSDEIEPPYYVLLSQTRLPGHAIAPGPTSFIHPVIEYHFADDPPHILLPNSPSESVIILDYDGSSTPIAQSLHKSLAVNAVKVSEAPGAAVAAVREGQSNRNDKMYVIEIINGMEDRYVFIIRISQVLLRISSHSNVDESVTQLDHPQSILTQFKERYVTNSYGRHEFGYEQCRRNAVLKKVLDLPTLHANQQIQEPNQSQRPSRGELSP